MDWIQVLTILGGNLGAFLWATKQARADFLHLDKKLDENRKETTLLVRAIEEDSRKFRDAMLQESKDFHNKLCSIEGKKTK